MMETRTIEHDDIRIVVSQATVLMGMKRSRMREEARHSEEENVDRRILAFWTYPDLMGATLRVEGIPWPIDFETFLGLPEPLVAKWEKTVYDLNPHWLPMESDSGASEKKASNSENG